MRWTHLKPADGRLMPWKNGGGTTLELAVDPPGASLDTGFQWRLSTADVATSGPFSAFPGLERWLLLLEGAGFIIDFGTRGQTALTEPLVPLQFSGDWPATATLIAGPSTDFNLMLNPGDCSANLEILRLERTTPLISEADTTLVFVAQGTVYVPEMALHLGRRHLLRIDESHGTFHLVPGYGAAAVIFINLRRT